MAWAGPRHRGTWLVRSQSESLRPPPGVEVAAAMAAAAGVAWVGEVAKAPHCTILLRSITRGSNQSIGLIELCPQALLEQVVAAAVAWAGARVRELATAARRTKELRSVSRGPNRPATPQENTETLAGAGAGGGPRRDETPEATGGTRPADLSECVELLIII